MTSYRYEYMPNSDYVTLHVGVRVCEESFVNGAVGVKNPETAELYALMKSTMGAEEISLRPFNISIRRGKAFERDEVLDSAFELFKMWYGMRAGIVEWVQKPTIRTDIRAVQCRECRAEMEREMELSMRDFDVLDID